MTKIKPEDLGKVAQNRRASWLYDRILEGANKPGRELLPVLKKGYCDVNPVNGTNKSSGLKLAENAIVNNKIVKTSQAKMVPWVNVPHTFTVVVDDQRFDVTHGETEITKDASGNLKEVGVSNIPPKKNGGGVSMYDLNKDTDIVKFLMLSPLNVHTPLRKTETLKSFGIEIKFDSNSERQTAKYVIDVNGQGLKMEDKAKYDRIALHARIMEMNKEQLKSVCKTARISYPAFHEHDEDLMTAMVVAIGKAIDGDSPAARKAYSIVSSYIEMDGSDHAKTVNKAVDLGILTFDGDQFRINNDAIEGKFPPSELTGADVYQWLILNMQGKEGVIIEANLEKAIMTKVGDTKINAIDQRNEEEKLVEKMMANLIEKGKVTRNTTTQMLEWEDDKETIVKCKAPQAKNKLNALKLAYGSVSYIQVVELCKKHDAENCIEMFKADREKSFSVS